MYVLVKAKPLHKRPHMTIFQQYSVLAGQASLCGARKSHLLNQSQVKH